MADTGGSVLSPAIVKTVTAGTRVQFPAIRSASAATTGGVMVSTGKSILVQALSTNEAPVVIGDVTCVAAAGTKAAPTQIGIELQPSQTLALDLIDTSALYLDTRKDKDGVAILVLTA